MHQGRAQALACGLGWFSIALGITQLVAPRFVCELAGMKASTRVVRLFGLREIATGVGILLAWKRGPWIWARVAGDALDIATARRLEALAALAGVTAVDVGAAVTLNRLENAPR